MEALGFDANRATAISPSLAQYRIVHFATHALLDSKNPELSGLVLSLVNKHGRPQNGFLNLEQIYNLNLPADLIVAHWRLRYGNSPDKKSGEGLD